jgi:CoA:oxalate CoA-transferase
MGALSGLRVLELGHYIAGPFCGQILADHGAEVIKVEPPWGEPARHERPRINGTSLYFPSLNRGKRSLALNLRDPSGKSLLKRLTAEVDVLITNYGPDVPAKLGLDYPELAKHNPRLVMLQLTGFGLNGPMRNRRAFDGAIQAMSGLMHLTGDSDGPPRKAGVYVADHLTGIQGAMGVLMALQARHTTGRGQLVDVAMLDSMMSLITYEFAGVAHGLEASRRDGNRSNIVFATTFETLDGYVYIAPISDDMWRRLCKAMGRPELASDTSPSAKQEGRLADYSTLEEMVTQWTIRLTTEELVGQLESQEIPHGVVHEPADLIKHPQVTARNMLVDIGYEGLELCAPGVVIQLSDEPTPESWRAPSLGEDTVRILRDMGCPPQEINELLSKGIAVSREHPGEGTSQREERAYG